MLPSSTPQLDPEQHRRRPARLARPGLPPQQPPPGPQQPQLGSPGAPHAGPAASSSSPQTWQVSLEVASPRPQPGTVQDQSSAALRYSLQQQGGTSQQGGRPDGQARPPLALRSFSPSGGAGPPARQVPASPQAIEALRSARSLTRMLCACKGWRPLRAVLQRARAEGVELNAVHVTTALSVLARMRPPPAGSASSHAPHASGASEQGASAHTCQAQRPRRGGSEAAPTPVAAGQERAEFCVSGVAMHILPAVVVPLLQLSPHERSSSRPFP